MRQVTDKHCLAPSIADVQGEWHEMEAKQDRARKRQQENQAGGEVAKAKA